MMWWDEGYGTGGWIFGSIMMLAVLVFIVVGVVLLVRGLSGRQEYGQSSGGPGAADRPVGSGNAMQILEERYARGDITREEFLRCKKDLLDK